MPRRNVTNQATYYDQRQTKDARDESKRRKMIRWLKSKIGIEDERGEGGAGAAGRSSKPSRERASLSTNGSAEGNPSFSNVYTAQPYGQQFITREHRTHVLIVGGGIGGLCLAQGLKKNGIPFTVFERDPTPNYRTQGYRLRINSSGYEALKANLSPANFEVFLRSTGHFQPGFKYLDAHTGEPTNENAAFSHKSTKIDHVFSADRAMLRSLLLTDLSDFEIQFGHAFKRYDRAGRRRRHDVARAAAVHPQVRHAARHGQRRDLRQDADHARDRSVLFDRVHDDGHVEEPANVAGARAALRDAGEPEGVRGGCVGRGAGPAQLPLLGAHRASAVLPHERLDDGAGALLDDPERGRAALVRDDPGLVAAGAPAPGAASARVVLLPPNLHDLAEPQDLAAVVRHVDRRRRAHDDPCRHRLQHGAPGRARPCQELSRARRER
ncbi:hypothetical protein PybrP1_007248 [[Pythium] brassicae (nom. inval.)]|nr:hypothetical protein PybrP1_007248 [[Pythium] brassicae (nom. inval.)]